MDDLIRDIASDTDEQNDGPLAQGIPGEPEPVQRDPAEPEVEPPPPLNEEHEQELAADIRLRAEYAEMMQTKGWARLSKFLIEYRRQAMRDLVTLTDMREIYRCQVIIRIINEIDDHIDGVFRTAAAAQSHKAEGATRQP